MIAGTQAGRDGKDRQARGWQRGDPQDTPRPRAGGAEDRDGPALGGDHGAHDQHQGEHGGCREPRG